MPRMSDMMTDEQINSAVDHFSYLYGRWQDEKEHEEFQDYVNSMANKLPTTATHVGMTKKPFRVTFMLEGTKCYIQYKGRHVEYGTMGPPK